MGSGCDFFQNPMNIYGSLCFKLPKSYQQNDCGDFSSKVIASNFNWEALIIILEQRHLRISAMRWITNISGIPLRILVDRLKDTILDRIKYALGVFSYKIIKVNSERHRSFTETKTQRLSAGQ